MSVIVSVVKLALKALTFDNIEDSMISDKKLTLNELNLLSSRCLSLIK